MGLFANVDMPRGTRLPAPYRGRRLTLEQFKRLKDPRWCYTLDEGRHWAVDGKQLKRGNPLRYVNGARTPAQRRRVNVVGLKIDGQPWFVTTSLVKKGSEFLISELRPWLLAGPGRAVVPAAEAPRPDPRGASAAARCRQGGGAAAPRGGAGGLAGQPRGKGYGREDMLRGERGDHPLAHSSQREARGALPCPGAGLSRAPVRRGPGLCGTACGRRAGGTGTLVGEPRPSLSARRVAPPPALAHHAPGATRARHAPRPQGILVPSLPWPPAPRGGATRRPRAAAERHAEQQLWTVLRLSKVGADFSGSALGLPGSASGAPPPPPGAGRGASADPRNSALTSASFCSCRWFFFSSLLGRAGGRSCIHSSGSTSLPLPRPAV
ncbi:unnamed protein product [Prorocentrum cordatum]|uniref:Uncharacterized protein n=1 Tax=Prorocentrum cordatum TaxID=2364126 RepID=A0ABN9SAN4_9DINO|nr:unnamed protein product [Polarella glacialis]